MGGGKHSPEVMPKADQDLDAMRTKEVPITYRDKCAHLLIKLNDCRYDNYYNPLKCGHERHTYEECEYVAWKQRIKAKKAQVKAAKKAAEAVKL